MTMKCDKVKRDESSANEKIENEQKRESPLRKDSFGWNERERRGKEKEKRFFVD